MRNSSFTSQTQVEEPTQKTEEGKLEGQRKTGKGWCGKATERVFLKGSRAPLWSAAFRAAKTSNSNGRGRRFERMEEVCCGE